MEQVSPILSQNVNFVRVYEVWTPNDSSELLQLNSAYYGGLTSFEELSLKTSFAYGEGLPGMAWQQQRPVVLKDFDTTSFLRAEAAHAVGLTSGVAIPIFASDELKAVLVMLCGEKDSATGAIEVWQDDQLSGMAWVDGYYGDMQRFEWLSKLIKFPPGVGLPGSVWQSATPQIIGDLPHSTSFLRAANARDAGISTGIGIPFYSPANTIDVTAVLTFLSANKTPIARRFEVWETLDNTDDLYFVAGIDQDRDKVEPADTHRRLTNFEGTVGQALKTGIPIISDSPKNSAYHSMLAIPIQRLDKSYTVAVFYL